MQIIHIFGPENLRQMDTKLRPQRRATATNFSQLWRSLRSYMYIYIYIYTHSRFDFPCMGMESRPCRLYRICRCRISNLNFHKSNCATYKVFVIENWLLHHAVIIAICRWHLCTTGRGQGWRRLTILHDILHGDSNEFCLKCWWMPYC